MNTLTPHIIRGRESTLTSPIFKFRNRALIGALLPFELITVKFSFTRIRKCIPWFKRYVNHLNPINSRSAVMQLIFAFPNILTNFSMTDIRSAVFEFPLLSRVIYAMGKQIPLWQIPTQRMFILALPSFQLVLSIDNVQRSFEIGMIAATILLIETILISNNRKNR